MWLNSRPCSYVQINVTGLNNSENEFENEWIAAVSITRAAAPLTDLLESEG
jgi:hypothetical protein